MTENFQAGEDYSNHKVLLAMKSVRIIQNAALLQDDKYSMLQQQNMNRGQKFHSVLCFSGGCIQFGYRLITIRGGQFYHGNSVKLNDVQSL